MRLRFPFSRHRCAPVWRDSGYWAAAHDLRSPSSPALGSDRRQQALLERARCGCGVTHRALLAEQRRWLKPWCERESRLRGKTEAEDLMHETLVRAWHGFAQFRGATIAEYRGWLKTIARRSLADVMRRRARERRLRATIACGSMMQQDHALAAEAADELEWLLADLRGRARRIVVLHALEERSFCEIACEVGCCTRTVRREWHRAREMLRRRIESRNRANDR